MYCRTFYASFRRLSFVIFLISENWIKHMLVKNEKFILKLEKCLIEQSEKNYFFLFLQVWQWVKEWRIFISIKASSWGQCSALKTLTISIWPTTPNHKTTQ